MSECREFKVEKCSMEHLIGFVEDKLEMPSKIRILSCQNITMSYLMRALIT